MRRGVGIVQLSEAVSEPPNHPDAAPEDAVPKRWRRGSGGRASASIRTSEDELHEWRIAADRAGMKLSAWLRRAADETAELERAASRHPDRTSVEETS